MRQLHGKLRGRNTLLEVVQIRRNRPQKTSHLQTTDWATNLRGLFNSLERIMISLRRDQKVSSDNTNYGPHSRQQEHNMPRKSLLGLPPPMPNPKPWQANHDSYKQEDMEMESKDERMMALIKNNQAGITKNRSEVSNLEIQMTTEISTCIPTLSRIKIKGMGRIELKWTKLWTIWKQ